jgi:taurine--2-oxoglutarate transaminase
MDALAAKHPSYKSGRCIGLFGMIDVQRNSAGDPAAPYNGSSPAMAELGRFFREQGLFTFVRWGHIMCNPPLTITEEQLAEGFDIIDRGLSLVDEHFEG